MSKFATVVAPSPSQVYELSLENILLSTIKRDIDRSMQRKEQM